jgi:hypothetical protein
MKPEIKKSIPFNQLLDLVKHLSRRQKIRLTRELEKEAIETKLSALLTSFRTDELSQEVIDEEVEFVRSQRYAEKQKHSRRR